MLGALLALSFRVVNLTFGGGEPTMAVFYQECVERRKWLTAEDYALIFGLARVTPGTNLLAFCVGCGWWLRGWPGAIGVALATSVPSAVAVVLFTVMYGVLKRYPDAAAVIAGTLAAAVGLMTGGSYLLVRRYLTRTQGLRTMVLTLGAMALSLWLEWSPIWVLLVAAVVGWGWRNGEEEEDAAA